MEEAVIFKLIAEARAARENAYCPYSKFKVGAALLASSGKIYRGCNVENTSFPAGWCAERSALGAAITAGEKAFQAIAVAGGGGITPCGVCRQALWEFGDFTVICAGASGEEYKITTVNRLMPDGFKM